MQSYIFHQKYLQDYISNCKYKKNFYVNLFLEFDNLLKENQDLKKQHKNFLLNNKEKKEKEKLIKDYLISSIDNIERLQEELTIKYPKLFNDNSNNKEEKTTPLNKKKNWLQTLLTKLKN